MRLILSISFLAVLGIASVVVAKPADVKLLQATYSVKSTSALGQAGCGACHVGKTAKLNPYGKDLSAAMAKASSKKLTGAILKGTESLDSDKDGKTNGVEVRAGTLPGDSKSK